MLLALAIDERFRSYDLFHFQFLVISGIEELQRNNGRKTLKSKDEKSAKEIETQMRKLQRIQVRFHFCFLFLVLFMKSQIQTLN